MPRGIPKDKSFKQRIIHRLKISRGHLDKVIQMVDRDEYCIDVVHQSLAVQAGLREIDNLVLKNHLETCVADSIKRGEVKVVVDEIVEVLKKK